MDIEVGKAIKELLYEHPAVILPGFGGFTSSAQAANVDYVQGSVQPPGKKLEFNPNLTTNDGLLVHHIQEQYTITAVEAKAAVDRFVEDVRMALERREIVEIPNIGRLYRDFEQKIRYLPDSTNFNSDAFGLPQVSFEPVTRSQTTTTKADKPAVGKSAAKSDQTLTAKPKTKAPDSGNWLQKYLPWMVLLSAIILALTIFALVGGFDKYQSGNQNIDKDRLNVKPATEVETDSTTAGTVPEEKSLPEDEDTEQHTFAAGKQTCLIIVHSFGKRENARKFAQQLAEDGYSAETKIVGPLYRVGVNFAYTSLAEVDRMIEELAAKYKAGPKVFGEEE